MLEIFFIMFIVEVQMQTLHVQINKHTKYSAVKIIPAKFPTWNFCASFLTSDCETIGACNNVHLWSLQRACSCVTSTVIHLLLLIFVVHLYEQEEGLQQVPTLKSSVHLAMVEGVPVPSPLL